MTWRTRIEIFCVLIAAGIIWYYAHPEPAPVNQWGQAKSAPQVAHVEQQTLACKPVVVYAQAAKQNLALPPAIKSDANQYVLSTAQLNSSLRPETLTTVYDAQTGQSETLVRRDSYPWLAAEQTGKLGFDVGVKNGMERVGRLSFEEDLIQVKALHAGISTSLDTDGAYFVGAGIGYRW